MKKIACACAVLAIVGLAAYWFSTQPDARPERTSPVADQEEVQKAEENPVARRFLADGPAFLILFKVGLVLIGSYPLLRFRRMRLAELASVVILVAYGLLAVHWSACYELYTLTASGHINIAEIDAIR